MKLIDSLLEELSQQCSDRLEITNTQERRKNVASADTELENKEETYSITISKPNTLFLDREVKNVGFTLINVNDDESAYITFIKPEYEFLSYKYEISSTPKNPDEYEVAECQEAENICEIEEILQPRLYNVAELKDCLKSAIIQWLGLKEK